MKSPDTVVRVGNWNSPVRNAHGAWVLAIGSKPNELFLTTGIIRLGFSPDNRFALVPKMRLNYFFDYNFHNDESETYTLPFL